VGKVSMQDLFQLGVRDADISAPDSRHTSDDGVLERIAKGVSANHPSRAHNYQANPTRPRSIHPRLPVAAKALIEPIWLVAHDNGRSSIQSTSSRRSRNSHERLIFTN